MKTVSMKYIVVTLFCSFISFGLDGLNTYAEEEYIVQQTFKLGKKNIYDAIFSSDNHFIITLSGTHKLELRDSRLGTLIKAFSTGKHKAISLLAHPDNSVLITGGNDHSIHFWDINRGTTKGVLRGHISSVKSLAIHEEGHLLVSGGVGGTILVWDVPNMVLQSTILRAHQGTIHSVDIHPNGKLIVSGGKDRKIRIWNSETGQLIMELTEHAGEVTAVAFHPNGRLLASASRDKTIKLWNWQERYVEYTLTGHQNVISDLSFHQKGNLLVSGGLDKSIRLWATKNGKAKGALKSVKEQVVAVHFDHDGKRIIAAMEKGIVQTWKINTSSFFGELKGHKRLITSLDFTKNNKYLLSSALDKTIKIWNVRKQKLVATYPMGRHRVEELRISPDSRSFATAGADSQIGLWDTQSGKRKATLVSHKGKINSIDFHPTEGVLLSGGADKQWILWDLKKFNTIKTNATHTNQVTTVRFSSDGKRFATGSADKSIIVWSYPEGRILFRLTGHRKTISTLVFSPNMPVLASAAAETVKIWDIQNRKQGRLRYNLEGHDFLVAGIAFSTDGNVLISSSRDKTTRLWDVKEGDLIRILSGERTAISSLSLRPDGKLMALGTLANDIVLLEYPFDLANVPQKIPMLKKTVQASSPRQSKIVSNNGAPDENAFVVDQSDLEDLESGELPNTQIYQLSQVENLSVVRAERQNTLDAVLLKGETCKNLQELEESAFKVLEKAPEDLSAYHALLKVAIAEKDINRIFLISKIGSWATFTSRYSYAQDIDVKNDFKYWSNQVFDQSQVRDENTVNLSIESCQGETEQIPIPEILYYLDIPHEFLKSVTSIPRLIDLKDFKFLNSNEFKNRLFIQIQEKLESPKSNIEKRPSLESTFQSKEIQTGQLILNFEETQRWGYPTRVVFQLRERGTPWQSFYTANDKRKILILPTGQYYLKIGGKIRRAFELIANSDVVVEGDGVQ